MELLYISAGDSISKILGKLPLRIFVGVDPFYEGSPFYAFLSSDDCDYQPPSGDLIGPTTFPSI